MEMIIDIKDWGDKPFLNGFHIQIEKATNDHIWPILTQFDPD